MKRSAIADPTGLDHGGVIHFREVRGEAMDRAVETLLAEMEKDADAKTAK